MIIVQALDNDDNQSGPSQTMEPTLENNNRSQSFKALEQIEYSPFNIKMEAKLVNQKTPKKALIM